VGELKSDVSELKGEVGDLKTGQAKLEADVGELKVGQAQLEAGQAKLEAGQVNLEKGQAKLKLGQEDLSSRLDLSYSLLEFSSKINQRTAADMHRFHKEAMDNINRLGQRVVVLEED
jgi:peptidoglycan hydrolase CwlO-like protein